MTLERLRKKTPEYFKKIRAFCLWWIGSATAFLAMDTTLKLPTPGKILTIINYSIAISTAIAFTSSLPVVTPTEPTPPDPNH